MSQNHSLRVRVTEVIRETADAHTLVLRHDEADVERFRYRSGQFLTVRIPTDRSEGAARCYSLCSSPLLDEPMMITVKRTPDGYGSNWICDHVTEGTELEVLRPSGTFTPHTLDQDFLLVAGGSGITPVLSILKSALHSGTGAVTLLYANRDQDSVIFAETLRSLVEQYPARVTVLHWLESVQGRPTRPALQALLAPYAGRNAYLCGPAPFMDAVSAALHDAGAASERIHIERYLSLANDPFADVELVVTDDDDDTAAATVTVTLDGETRELSWPGGNHLLDVFLAAGLDAPFSCRAGQCSACACRVLSGEVTMDNNEVLEQEDLDDGYVLACQSVAKSDTVVVTYDD
ncbi:MAG: ferredoxin--NADP reductase [Jatrophihabitans sp.]